jgi:hypothetical protein
MRYRLYYNISEWAGAAALLNINKETYSSQFLYYAGQDGEKEYCAETRGKDSQNLRIQWPGHHNSAK